MQTTTNYELKKPETTDIYDISNENDNMDVIDAIMKSLSDNKLNNSGDSQNNVTTFTSSDVADGNATAWTSVTKLESLEAHKSIFAKVSQMFKNVRYLYKLLGTTDVSSFFGGSSQDITGALSTLNTHIGSHTLAKDVPSDAIFTDNDSKVAQTNTTTSADYRVLFSDGANDTTETKGVRKNANLKYNPNTGNLQATQLNGVTIGSSPKFTDTTYTSKAAASGGTDESLVTTGEKYTWNHKQDALTNPLTQSDVKDNLTSTDTTKPLSANQGKVLDRRKLGEFVSTSDVTISSVTYHTYWEVAPTSSNQVYGVAVHPTSGKLCRIYNNKGSYSMQLYDKDTTYNGSSVKTSAAKTGSGSILIDSIASGTTMDNAIGTLLNNDHALEAKKEKDLTDISITGTTNNTGSTIRSGTYFYLNGELEKALTDIANGATFTVLTNYETVADGALNALNSALTPQLTQNPTIIVTNATTDSRTFFYQDSYHAHVHLVIKVTTASSNFTVRNLHSILGITGKSTLQTYGVAFTNNDSTQTAKSISVDLSNDILWIDMGASIAVGKYIYADIDVYYY